MIEIRASRVSDIERIIPRLRAHDRKTIERLSLDPARLLRQTLENGNPMLTAVDDGVPICMWGIDKQSLLSPWMIWMLTTDAIDNHQVKFLRWSRILVREWGRQYGTLEGWVDADFGVSVRWLRWLGFKEIADGDFKRMRYVHGN